MGVTCFPSLLTTTLPVWSYSVCVWMCVRVWVSVCDRLYVWYVLCRRLCVCVVCMCATNSVCMWACVCQTLCMCMSDSVHVVCMHVTDCVCICVPQTVCACVCVADCVCTVIQREVFLGPVRSRLPRDLTVWELWAWTDFVNRKGSWERGSGKKWGTCVRTARGSVLQTKEPWKSDGGFFWQDGRL